MKLQQTSTMQTGIAIFKNHLKEEIQVPLFAAQPILEAQGIALELEDNYTLEHVFYSNSMYESGWVENQISDFINTYGFLPSDLMECLKSGFSCVTGKHANIPYPNMFYC